MKKLERNLKNYIRVAHLDYGHPVWFYDDVSKGIIRGEVYNTYADGLHLDVTIENHCGSICIDFDNLYYID